MYVTAKSCKSPLSFKRLVNLEPLRVTHQKMICKKLTKKIKKLEYSARHPKSNSISIKKKLEGHKMPYDAKLERKKRRGHSNSRSTNTNKNN